MFLSTVYREKSWLLFRISREDSETEKRMDSLNLLTETLDTVIGEKPEATDVKELTNAITKAVEAKTNYLKEKTKEKQTE